MDVDCSGAVSWANPQNRNGLSSSSLSWPAAMHSSSRRLPAAELIDHLVASIGCILVVKYRQEGTDVAKYGVLNVK